MLGIDRPAFMASGDSGVDSTSQARGNIGVEVVLTDPLIQALRRGGDVSPAALSHTFTDIPPEQATDVRDTCRHLDEPQ